MANARTLREEVESLGTPQGRAYLRGCIAGYRLPEDDVQDLIQTALELAWVHADRFDGRSKPATYVAAIVINAARNHVTRRARDDARAELVATRDATADTTARTALARVDLADTRRALDSLPPQFGRAIGLAIVCDSYAQAAELEGVAEATFKSRVWRARRALLAALADDHDPAALPDAPPEP